MKPLGKYDEPIGHLEIVGPWFKAAVAALKASRWTMLRARWFGRRVEGVDMGNKVVGYEWRGRLYLTDFQKTAEDS